MDTPQKPNSHRAYETAFFYNYFGNGKNDDAENAQSSEAGEGIYILSITGPKKTKSVHQSKDGGQTLTTGGTGLFHLLEESLRLGRLLPPPPCLDHLCGCCVRRRRRLEGQFRHFRFWRPIPREEVRELQSAEAGATTTTDYGPAGERRGGLRPRRRGGEGMRRSGKFEEGEDDERRERCVLHVIVVLLFALPRNTPKLEMRRSRSMDEYD